MLLREDSFFPLPFGSTGKTSVLETDTREVDENRFDRTRYNARIDLPTAVSWVSPWSANTDLSRYSTCNSVKSNIDAIELNALFLQVVVRVIAK